MLYSYENVKFDQHFTAGPTHKHKSEREKDKTNIGIC